MVIDDKGENLGVFSIGSAISLAENKDLDLVEVSPNARPPVCKVLDYGKFKFQMVKQKSEARKKQKSVQIKEVKFRPNTDKGDYEVKLRSLLKFINDGSRVKVTLRFKGREAKFQEFGVAMLERVKTDISEYAIVESDIKLEGRQLSIVCTQKKSK